MQIFDGLFVLCERVLQINKLNLLKPLIRQIEENSGNIWPYFSMADKVTYRFYMGRKAMFDAQLTDGNCCHFSEKVLTIFEIFSRKIPHLRLAQLSSGVLS